MLLFETDNGRKKICIWKDENPINYLESNKLCLCVEAGETYWHMGTICIEAKLHSRHISNYAMISMKYIKEQKDKTDIVINYGQEKKFFKSYVLPFNKNVFVGLNKEFADAIDEFFREYPSEKLPRGTIEILSGGYDEVGSSNVAFKKVMELLLFTFQHIDELNDNELKYELLNIL